VFIDVEQKFKDESRSFTSSDCVKTRQEPFDKLRANGQVVDFWCPRSVRGELSRTMNQVFTQSVVQDDTQNKIFMAVWDNTCESSRNFERQ